MIDLNISAYTEGGLHFQIYRPNGRTPSAVTHALRAAGFTFSPRHGRWQKVRAAQ